MARSNRRTYILTNCLKGILLLLIINGCSTTKFLKENETLYTGASVKLESKKGVSSKKEIKSELTGLIRPKPNLSIFGARPRLWIYYTTKEPKKEKGLGHWLKYKVGKPPVLLSDAKPGYVQNSMSDKLFNMGFFNNKVTYEINRKKKKADIEYIASVSKPYTLRKIEFPKDSSDILSAIDSVSLKTILRAKSRFSLEDLQEERQRIENGLKDQGFYYFDNEDLIYEIDTTVGNKEVDLYLMLKDNMPEKSTQTYSIKEIDIYPNYSFATVDSALNNKSVVIDSMNYFSDSRDINPEVITNAVLLNPGNKYSRALHTKSLSRLIGLGVFKYVDIRFLDDSTNNQLTAKVYLTPLKKKSLRFQAEFVSKSNNFLGPGVELTYSNRNIFGGAELLNISLTSSFETQINGKQNRPLNSFEIGLEGRLTIPRFLTPFNFKNRYKFVPQTTFTLGASVMDRVDYFRLQSTTFSYSFLWKESQINQHQLSPVDINFVHLTNKGPLFEELLEDNPFLANNYQDQFIIGGGYSYVYNSKLKLKSEGKTHNFYAGVNLDIAGNLLYLLQSSTNNFESSVSDPYTIFGFPYAQFAKAQFDLRHYYRIDKQNNVASRLIVGIGVPYGNSYVLPYIKQFSSGGSNSIRAFRARSLGPGTYYNDSINTQNAYIDETGDIKLEGSLEYRFDIIGPIKGAVFVDAGNVWLANEDTTRVGGKFDATKFINQLAVGNGVGIRLATKFFVLRLDVAFPIRKIVPKIHDDPNSEAQFEWVFDNVNFGDKNWRKENIVWNIAIGYPF